MDALKPSRPGHDVPWTPLLQALIVIDFLFSTKKQILWLWQKKTGEQPECWYFYARYTKQIDLLFVSYLRVSYNLLKNTVNLNIKYCV